MSKAAYTNEVIRAPLTDSRMSDSRNFDAVPISTIPESGFIIRLPRSRALAKVAVFAAATFPGAAIAKDVSTTPNQGGSHMTTLQSVAHNLYTYATPDMLPAANSVDSSTPQQNLDAFGTDQVNKLQGFSVDFQQKTLSVTPEEGTLITDFECPPTDSPKRVEIESIQVFPGNKADVKFCPSEETIKVSKPDSNPMYADPMAKLLADPLRSEEDWIGDEYRKESNVYYECPQLPSRQNPKIKFKYNDETKVIRVGFDVGNISPYCDKPGQFVDKLTAQIKRPKQKQWRSVGRTVLVVETVKGALAARYGASEKVMRESARITETGDLRKPDRKLDSRILLKEMFVPNPAQKFIHDSNGGTTPLKYGSHTYRSYTKRISN
jgi:hypothetical protein